MVNILVNILLSSVLMPCPASHSTSTNFFSHLIKRPLMNLCLMKVRGESLPQLPAAIVMLQAEIQ